jgi:hypothetical protein
MFQTNEKIEFWFDDPYINFLYMNGVVDEEIVNTPEEDHKIAHYLKFTCPFVQKRLFNYFSRTLFRHLGELYPDHPDAECKAYFSLTQSARLLLVAWPCTQESRQALYSFYRRLRKPCTQESR